MTRVLLACLLLAACGAPAARPAPTLAHARVIADSPVAAVPAEEPPAAEVGKPAWLEPPPSRRVVTSTSITILDQIAFIGPSAQIDPISYPMLDAIVATLDGNPSIRVMEIVVSGNDAPERWQQALGDRRAQTIMAYMVYKGANRARLRARGEAKAPQVSSFLILQRD